MLHPPTRLLKLRAESSLARAQEQLVCYREVGRSSKLNQREKTGKNRAYL